MRRFALVLILALSACAGSGNDPITAVYDCSNGQRLDVVFEPGQAIVTTENGTMATLEQKEVASGMWYSNKRYELRGKGKDAKWSIGRRKPFTCRAR